MDEFKKSNGFEYSDKEAYDICLKIADQILEISTSNAKVQEKYLHYRILTGELEFLTHHYHGTELNDVLTNLLASYENLKKQILENKTKFESMYGSSSDGFI